MNLSRLLKQKLENNMLPKSRRILYQAFNDKFYNVLNKICNYSLLSYIQAIYQNHKI